MSVETMKLEEVIRESKSPWPHFCDGFGSTNERGYICCVTLNCGSPPKMFRHGGSIIIDKINAYDVAETLGPYIGQINMIQASSFCGPMGGIWGYDDLAAHPELRKDFLFNVSRHDPEKKEKPIRVYSAEPLIEAAEFLLGTREDRHFPLIPGAHVPCAAKWLEVSGPCEIYCAIGIAIPEKSERNHAAVLWMEDVGYMSWLNDQKEIGITTEEAIRMLMAKSMVEIGKNQSVLFKELFVGVRSVKANDEQMACALVAVPYIKLAQLAFPNPNKPEKLMKITLPQWKDAVKDNFLSNVLKIQHVRLSEEEWARITYSED